MRCYVAKDRGTTYSGSWMSCLAWGSEQVKNAPTLVVKIHSIRMGEKLGRVVAEVTELGVRIIPNGRYLPRGSLWKARDGET